MIDITPEKTQFHGATYDEVRDRDRLNGALLRIYEFLSANKGKWISAPMLCNMADVSANSYRNRLSDLRVYHGCIIESENIKDGMWKYKYSGQMTDEQFKKYSMERQLKQIKPTGDKEKFGQVMRRLYAYAHDTRQETKIEVGAALNDWAMDFVDKIKSGEGQVYG